MRAIVAIAALLAACGPVPAADYGEALLADPRFSDSEFNDFACTTCHARGDDARILPGLPLDDVAFREAWWGGAAVRLLDAVTAASRSRLATA